MSDGGGCCSLQCLDGWWWCLPLCRRAGVVLVVGGLLAAVGWRGHSPAEGAGCLLLSALLLSYLEAG